jgi:uncharacterized protein YjbK
MASNNIEIESKVLLSKKDYEKLLDRIAFPAESVTQTNYYLDSDELTLKKYGMIVRIRENVGGKYVLTMKAPLAEGLLEKNQPLSKKEADAMIKTNVFPRGDIYDFLDILHIKPESLKILATLTTERKVAEYGEVKLDISKNTYGKKVDYELECDSDSAYKSTETLKEICDSNGIKYEINLESKESRAIKAAIGK